MQCRHIIGIDAVHLVCLVGNLIDVAAKEFLRQIKEQHYDIARINKRVIRSSDLNQDQKSKFYDITAGISEKLELDNGVLQPEDIGGFIIRVMQNRGLYRVIFPTDIKTPNQIVATEKKVSLEEQIRLRKAYYVSSEKWFAAYAKGLDVYASGLSVQDKYNLLIYMLKHMTDGGKMFDTPLTTVLTVLNRDSSKIRVLDQNADIQEEM